MTSFKDKFTELKTLENIARRHEQKYHRRDVYQYEGKNNRPDGIDIFVKCLLQSEVPGFVKLGTFLKEAYDLKDITESKYYAYINDTNPDYGKIDKELPENLSYEDGVNLHQSSYIGKSVNIVYKHVHEAERKAIKINNKHARMLNRAKQVRQFMHNGYYEIIDGLEKLVKEQYDKPDEIDSYLRSSDELAFANKSNYRIR